MYRSIKDYPIGVQDLLRWAGYHLEQLDKLEREFRAWEQAQDIDSVQLMTLNMVADSFKAQRRRDALQGPYAPSGAEAARLRWEMRISNGRG